MTQNHNSQDGLETVIGPYGERISMSDLPRPGTRRWVIRRKALVVAAVDGGLLTLDEACTRYSLSNEEFESWARDYHEFGLQGLRVTRLQHYRKKISDTLDEVEGGLPEATIDYEKAAE